jgi:hypothetical protein
MKLSRILAPALIATAAATSCVSDAEPRPATLWSRYNGLLGDPYPLDVVERRIPEGTSRVACSEDDLIDYLGTTLRYHGAVKIVPPFRERLERFEQVVAEVATEVYGRPPRRIRHLGAFSCRSARNRTHRLSEHAFGNAIDIAGFDFGPATKDQQLAPGLPRHLERSFEVRVARHWNKTSQPAAIHARFLELLTARLVERGDVFRSAIGPSHPGHRDHFHFDMSPWRFVRL